MPKGPNRTPPDGNAPSDDALFEALMATVRLPHWPLLLPIALVAPETPVPPAPAAIAPPPQATRTRDDGGATHVWRHEAGHLSRCERCGTHRATVPGRRDEKRWLYQTSSNAPSTSLEPRCRPSTAAEATSTRARRASKR